MGNGLGKNSPVVLSFGKENYEALIERHGQWVRWRTASKCSCVKPGTQQPDIHCEKCAGLGVVFGYQKDAVVTTTVMTMNDSGMFEIDEEYTNCMLVKAYDNSSREYPDAEKFGNIINLNSEVTKGIYVTVVMVQNIMKFSDKAECEPVGDGYYRVKGLTVSRKKIDGLYHTAPSDIETVGKVYDSEGTEFTVKELRQDCIYIEPDEEKPVIHPLYAENIQYIEPFTFAVLSQELTKSDAEAVQESNGQAIVSFPYAYDVAEDDVLTVLAGTITQKKVLARTRARYDVLPAYFVESITYCSSEIREYVNGIDFMLVGTNRIRWLCDDAPEAGEPYSVTYHVFPTYKVVKPIPQLRTSEDQRLPKKVVVKYYDTYGEVRGVNRQG